MKRILSTLLLLCLFLTSCASTGTQTPEEDNEVPISEADADAPTGYALALTLPLTDVEPYEPWLSMEPDTVSADTMGDILCDETLPDGTEIVCYWDPDHLTNPDHAETKYWVIRRGDSLLRFCQESSSYADGYAVTAFTNILGQDGFHITAPRGAAYTANDYYVLDDSGTPCLLADCSGGVIEADVNGDGETELFWSYHDGTLAYYFLRNGTVYEAMVNVLLHDALPFSNTCFGSTDSTWQDGFLAMTILPNDGDEQGEALSEARSLRALLRFGTDEIFVYLPAEQVPLD